MFREHTVLLVLNFGSLRHDILDMISLNVSLPLRRSKEKKPLCLPISEVKRDLGIEEISYNVVS